ncbi:MAG: ribonuclease P protein component [Candidatus Levybacteria bacterium]|nr:ribonuclease P protein component [Candidatus Levybacteria bacterium]
MFKRGSRLAAGVRFDNSYSFSTSQFVLKLRENGLSLNRFGIIVSKKVDKRAVGRNKIKRMFRNVLVSLSKNMISGHDILFITRSGVLSKTKEENQKIVESAMEKAGIMRAGNES